MIPSPTHPKESLIPNRNYEDPFPPSYNQPNPNDPAFIFGRVVLRPAIDFTISVGRDFWNSFIVNSYFNIWLTAIPNLFPVAQAASTHVLGVDHLMKSNQILMNLGKKEAITVIKNGGLRVVKKNEYDTEEPVQKALMKLAEASGGIMSLSINPKNLPTLISILIDHIEANTSLDQPIDIAFVFNTAISMGNEINEWNKNFATSLGRTKNRNIRFAVLEYRDKGESYLHRVNANFTENKLSSDAKKLTFMEDQDPFHVSFDALQAAKDGLKWDKEAKRSIILVTDSMPLSKTVDNVSDDQTTAIFPILTYQPSLMIQKRVF